MQTRRACPLIYRCTGLCHEYAKPRHATADLGDWLSMRSSPSRGCSLPAGQSGLLGRGEHHGGVFCLSCTDAGNASDDDVLITSHHTSPSTHTQKKKISCPSSLPLPESLPFLFLSLYLLISAGFGTKNHLGKPTCQLRWAFTQKKTASTQHLSAMIKDMTVYPPTCLFRCLSACGAKTFHTLDGNYAKRVAHLPLRVSLRLCHFPALVFTRGAACILADCFVLFFELF